MRLLSYDELPKSLREANKYWDFFKAGKKGTSTIVLYRKDFEKQTWKKSGPIWTLIGRRTEKVDADQDRREEFSTTQETSC